MNILHLVPRDTFERKMSRERFSWMDAVADQVRPHGVHTTGPGWKDWHDELSARDNVRVYLSERTGEQARESLPHLIMAYEVEGLAGSPIPVCVILQEAYNRPKTLKLLADTDPALVIFTYQNEMAQYHAELEAAGRQVTVIPHSADDTVFKDYGLPKTIDILIAGNMNAEIYPFRARLARLAWRELRKRGYSVQWLPHPGYTLPPKAGLVGEQYARLLNASRLVITCTSRYKYALAKLAEIPLCRALPVSDLPAERQVFFSKTMLNVEPWMLDREILTRIEDVLDDEAEWLRRVQLAHDKIDQRLPMRFWAERFIYWGRRFLGEVDMPAPMPATGEDDA